MPNSFDDFQGMKCNDIIRYTYKDDEDNLVKSYYNINKIFTEKGYNQVKVKNFWNNEMSAYKGINCVYSSPNGLNFEVQFHTPESFEVKDRELINFMKKQD